MGLLEWGYVVIFCLVSGVAVLACAISVRAAIDVKGAASRRQINDWRTELTEQREKIEHAVRDVQNLCDEADDILQRSRKIRQRTAADRSATERAGGEGGQQLTREDVIAYGRGRMSD